MYRRIGKQIKYDFEEQENSNLILKNAKSYYNSTLEAFLSPEMINSHNLIGGLIDGKC